MEYQGQNIGTELATEELCRKLTGFRGEALIDSVKIWCGTYGSNPANKTKLRFLEAISNAPPNN